MASDSYTVLNNLNVNEVPITNEEYQNISDIQSEAKTQDILNRLCEMLEGLLPNALASLMLKKTSDGKTYQTFIFLDINNFAYVNTDYGFDIGDKILKITFTYGAIYSNKDFLK